MLDVKKPYVIHTLQIQPWEGKCMTFQLLSRVGEYGLGCQITFACLEFYSLLIYGISRLIDVASENLHMVCLYDSLLMSIRIIGCMLCPY